MDVIDEAHIIKNLINGDDKAVEWVISNYKQRLIYFIQRSLPREEDVESLVQEVFIKLWCNRESLDSNRSLDTFIFTIAKNLLTDHLRKLVHRRKHVAEVIAISSDTDLSSMKIFEYQELEERVYDCIEALPEKRKEVFRLNKIEGKSYRDIAELLGVSENTVNVHMYKSKQFFKEKLKDYLYIFFL